MRTRISIALLILASILTPVFAADAPCVPKFIAPTVKSDYGGTWTWTNSDWFLDDASTLCIAKKFNAFGVEQQPVFVSGPYHVISPVGLKQNWLVFLGAKGVGIAIPAGFLGSYYTRWDAATAVTLIWKNLKDSGVLVIGQ
jgi:hypothetical protein